MYKSKALQILRTFSRKEMDRFRDYTVSPYCNSNRIVANLLAFLYPYYPNFDHPDLEKKLAYKQLYPRKKYNEAYLRKQLSGLYQLAKEFLIDEALRLQVQQRNTSLLNQLQQRSLDNIFHIQFAHFTEYLQEEDQKDASYFFNSFQLSEVANSFFDRQEDLDETPSLQAKADNLDVFYLVTKLSACCEMFFQQKKSNRKFQYHLVKEVFGFLEKEPNPFGNIPIVRIYWELLQMISNPQAEDSYLELKDLIFTHYTLFSPADSIRIFKYIQQYCLEKISSGDVEYLEELFQIWQFQLEKQIKFRNGYLPLEDYKSLTVLGLRLGAYDWVKEFLFAYQDKLPPKEAQDAFTYFYASWFYAKGDQEGLIDLLDSYRFKHISYATQARFLQMKTLYEQNKMRELNDLIDSFRLKLLRNKELSNQNRQSTEHFLKLLKRIARLRNDQSGYTDTFIERWEKIGVRLDQLSTLQYQKWLKEIWQELAPIEE